MVMLQTHVSSVALRAEFRERRRNRTVAANQGTWMHLQMELWLNRHPVDSTTPEMRLFLKFARSLRGPLCKKNITASWLPARRRETCHYECKLVARQIRSRDLTEACVEFLNKLWHRSSRSPGISHRVDDLRRRGAARGLDRLCRGGLLWCPSLVRLEEDEGDLLRASTETE